MKMSQLHALRDARPFRPFTIHLGVGRDLRIDHPEFLAPSPAEDIVIIFKPNGGFNIVDVALVTDLDVARFSAWAVVDRPTLVR